MNQGISPQISSFEQNAGPTKNDTQIQKGSLQPKQVFRDVVGASKDNLPIEAGRYHLYVSHACPWSSYALQILKLKGLEDSISYSATNP